MATREWAQDYFRARPSERDDQNRDPCGATNVAQPPEVVWGVDRRGAPHNVRPDQTRRNQQEDMAQIWCPQSLAGSTSNRELFCTPFLLSFAEPIAESQLNLVLAKGKRHLGLSTKLQRQVHNAGLIALHVLDEVFPMSGMRTASLQQASNAVHARSPDELRRVASSWTRPCQLPMRQSTGFLFYLVGIHAGPHDDSSYSDGADCSSIATEIDGFVGDTTGMTVTTHVKMFRRFFDGLFAGIWMYQHARLAQIASRALRSADAERVHARISVEVSRETHTIRLSLYADDSEGSASSHFRLTGRPGDDPGASVARISAVLQNAGINNIALAELEPRGMHIAAISSDPRDATRLAVPL